VAIHPRQQRRNGASGRLIRAKKHSIFSTAKTMKVVPIFVDVEGTIFRGVF
jgi:hypothetical protein